MIVKIDDDAKVDMQQRERRAERRFQIDDRRIPGSEIGW